MAGRVRRRAGVGPGRSAAKERFWRGHVARQASSGISVRAYCARQALAEPSFYAWRRELARRDRVSRPRPQPAAFVCLDLPEPSAARATVEIVLNGAVRILVPPGTARGPLREILAALGAVVDAEPAAC